MIDFKYYGLFLDEETKDRLKEVFILDLNNEEEYNLFSENNCEFILDHCTLLHKSHLLHSNIIVESLNKKLNQNIEIIIDATGCSNKAIAFRVKNIGFIKDYCMNKIPHITIATFNEGKLIDSNYITNWKPLDAPIKIVGTLKRI